MAERKKTSLDSPTARPSQPHLLQDDSQAVDIIAPHQTEHAPAVLSPRVSGTDCRPRTLPPEGSLAQRTLPRPHANLPARLQDTRQNTQKPPARIAPFPLLYTQFLPQKKRFNPSASHRFLLYISSKQAERFGFQTLQHRSAAE